MLYQRDIVGLNSKYEKELARTRRRLQLAATEELRYLETLEVRVLDGQDLGG
jgi:hypothetical protein